MKPLRWYDLISINLFWLGMNIRNTAIGSVFIPYLVDVFVRPEIKNTALGELRTAGLIIAMLVQPAAGILSDRSTSRFGRRRPFIFVGVLLDVVFMTGIILSGSYWALFLILLLQQMSANISHGPLQGVIPDLVPEEQRGRASGIKALFELLPLVLVAYTIARLVAAQQLVWAMVATIAALVLTMILTIFLVKEQPLTEKPTVPLKPTMLRVLGMLAGIGIGAAAGLLAGGLLGGLAGLVAWPLAGIDSAKAIAVGVGGLAAMLTAVVVGVWSGTLTTLGNQGTLMSQARRTPSFTWWVVNRLMFLAAATSIQGFAPYFVMSAFGVSREVGIEMTAKLTMVVGIFTLLTALPSGWLADKFGSKTMVGVAGLVATMGTLVLLSTTLVPNLPLMYVAGIIIGLGVGLFMTTNWALGTELAPRQEAGRYLGVSNLAGAGAGMIGAGLGGPVADMINKFQPGLGYFAIFACYAVLFFSSWVILRRVQHPATQAA